ncbi:MAG: hydroxymethylbilane synthase [Wenzhouxiangella sp.]
MIIATRQSKLALWQSEHAAAALRTAHPDLAVELLPLSTRGDEVLDRSLSEIGGKGVFLKELEVALLDGRADIAVHSLKDVPAESPEGLELAVVMAGGNWGDLWIGRDRCGPAEMPAGSKVGTSSLRRQSQLKRAWPHIEVVPIRGNVQTRLGLMTSGQVDAVILAAAGIERLALDLPQAIALSPPEFLPAPGQGVIVIQCRQGDEEVKRQLEALHCPTTAVRVAAERAVVARLGGDCRMPLAALASLSEGGLSLHARLTSPDGKQCLDSHQRGAPDEAVALGQRAAEALLAAGGDRIIAQL